MRDRAKQAAARQRYETSPKGVARRAAYATANRARLNIGKARNTRRYRAQRLALIRQLKSVPCADCGGTFDPVCMDFDHRPGEVKLFTISYRKGAPVTDIDALLAEIAKCDVVCANCHRLRTFRERDHAETCLGKKPSSAQLPLSLALKTSPKSGGLTNQ